ncbi:hypothetical protein SLS54_001741 [Diplodia seriata]
MSAGRFLALVSRAFIFVFVLLVLANNLAVEQDSANSILSTLEPGGSNATDDAVAIRDAFEECGLGGKVVFLNETYYVNSVLNTSGLEDVDVELHGTLLVSPDHQLPHHSPSELFSFPGNGFDD